MKRHRQQGASCPGSGPLATMIVRRFMHWVTTASAAERAEGASALARAFLQDAMNADEREDAQIALTALLDDTAPCVRKALAEAFGTSAAAPRSIVLALANDQSDIAAGVLRYSPLLSDSELIDCAAIGDAFAQASIALRPVVAAPVCAALAEVGHHEALIALAINAGADIPDFSARRMVARFGDCADLREALLSRADLSAVVRSDLVSATARALGAFVEARAWMSPERVRRVVRESCDRANLMIAADQDAGDAWQSARALAAHLRASGQLTPGFMLRTILSGNALLFEAALVDLSGLPERKALGLARQPRGAGLATLYRAAAMPEPLLPAFQAALQARAGMPAGSGSAALSRRMIESVLRACEAHGDGETTALLALLRRFETEAVREEARTAAETMRSLPVPLLPGRSVVPKARKEPRVIEIDLIRFEAELAAA